MSIDQVELHVVAIFSTHSVQKKRCFMMMISQFSAATSEAAEDVQGSFGQF